MKDKIVVYFSASGVTKKVAENIAEATDSDLYEIIPETKYTSEDLNWNNPDSRSSIEMKNKSTRPAIIGSVDNINEYNTIILGFPIWWYVAPTIINTFLEAHDLNGKKIVLFATSGSSGMGNTIQELKPSAPNSEFIAQKRVSASFSVKEAKEWIESLDI